jgi:hypothetical protein
MNKPKSLKTTRFVALLIAILLITSSQSVWAKPNKNQNAERAEAAYQALQTYFYQPDTKLYKESSPHTGNNKYSYVWPYGAAMQSTVALAKMPEIGEKYKTDIQDRLDGLAAYWNDTKAPFGYDSYVRAPLGGGGDKFYDDNDWIAIELIKIYHITGDVSALDRAKELFELQVYGWDTDPSHACPGGVFWTQASWSKDRNTVSNAPAAQIGLYLYEITKDAHYLDWAKKMYNWVNDCMQAPNGLYWDHIDLNGNIDKTQWSYNQGTMIGASVLLYKATGEKAYLNKAESIADAAIKYYGSSRIYTQPIVFNSIFFENLLMLDDMNKKPKYTDYVQNYADEVWKTLRNPETGVVEIDPRRSTELLEQAAFVTINAHLAVDKKKKD